MAVNDYLEAALQAREYLAVADEAVEAADGGPILDWGCGAGQISHLMVERGGDVSSFDYDPESSGAESVPFKRYPELSATRSNDPVRLPYEDASFDVVLSCGVLEHVAEPLASLIELRRVLRPGGTLLVYKLPNRFSLLELVARIGGLPYHGMRVHDTLWGVRSTRWALDAAGFDVEWVRRSNFLPLTVHHEALTRRADGLWRLNQRLARTPLLQLLDTNVEARAVKPAEVRRREAVS
ncbi:class I SAM-dependent methyltransferase [Patulibacter medicamentivorans]|jgi:SAM-dependent methyltransferase|uniref:class I SAM-dependent methyltransferase n=1 Tax=Patulibacter medicamentivorans TaxID=1097667 RepID=UPI00067FFD99|nr:class I SAM-dependent methyltransferase [Patulibacter medicamentivorans]